MGADNGNGERVDTGVEETHFDPKAQAVAGALGEDEGKLFVVRKIDGELVLATEDLEAAVRAADENAPALVETTQSQSQIEDLLRRALVFSGAADPSMAFAWPNELGAAMGGVTLAAYAKKTGTEIAGAELVEDPDVGRDEVLRLLGAALGIAPGVKLTIEQLAAQIIDRTTGSYTQEQIVAKLRSKAFVETAFGAEASTEEMDGLTEAIEAAFGWEAV